MPNNRGGIPMYNENPQYSATISSQLPQGSPASFGTQVAKEMAGMGDAIGKWGTNLVEHALKMQERDDNAFILEKDNEMRAAMTDLLYNPQNGLANTKGKNSFGVTQTYDEAVEKLTQDAMSGIGNPALQAKLQEHNMQWVNSLRTTIAKHEGGERFTYYSNNMNASSLSARNIGLQIGGVNGMQAGVAIIEGLRETGKSLLGWDDTMADNWIREQKSAIFDALIKDCIDRGDTAGQQALVDVFGGDVNGQSLLSAKSKLTVIQEQQDAVKMLDDAIKAHPEWIVDGILDEAKVSEWIENNYGQNAPDRIERVLVGGGGSFFSNQSVNADIAAAAEEFNVDPALVAAVAEAESNGNQGSVSGVGALGVMQLMPDTAASLGVDPNNQKDNIRGGAKYLRQMLDMFGGDVRKALAAYNAGPGAVKDYGGVPPYKETQNYVAKILDGTPDTGEAFYNKHKAKTSASNVSTDKLDDDIDASGVDLTGTKPQTIGMINRANQIHKEMFGTSLWVSATTGGHKAGTPHALGDKADVGSDALKNSYENRVKFQKALQDEGIGANNEYDQPSEGSTGGHFDLDVRGKNWQTGENFGGFKVSGARYVERKVSGYNPVMRDAMMARAKQAAANYKSDNTRKFNSYRDMLKQLPEVQNARDISEFRTVFQRYGIPQYMWDGLANAIGFDMKANISHENRVEADKNKAQREAAESVNAYILNEERNGRSVTADSLFTVPGFSNMSSGNQRSMYEHMKQAESTSDAHIGWYKGETKDAFESAVSSMKKSNGLDEMWVPNLRAGISAANMERKKKGEPAMSPAEIQQYVASQAMNWKVKGRLWGENSSDQMRAALLPGQYVSEDGRTVYDADGTELVWDEDMKMYRRP